MSGAAPQSHGTGARRVFHLGNAVLSAAVFFVTLVLSLVALNPPTSHYLLAERHRTPALNESGSELMAGFTPVTVEVNHSVVLVVPAPTTASSGTNRVSRKLDFFFRRLLCIAAVSDGGIHERCSKAFTLSDVILMVLLHADASSPSSFSSTPPLASATASASAQASRHRSFLHVCSALSCISPFVLQQWSNRGTAAFAMQGHQAIAQEPASSAQLWRRVHNFALVFGEVERARTLTRALTEHHVMVPDEAAIVGADVVMPLVGDLRGSHVVASCTPSAWCRYSNARTRKRVMATLQEEADALTSPAAKARVFAEWNRSQDGASAKVLSSPAVVRQRPLSSLLFGQRYPFHSVPFEVVCVDISGEDSVAAFGFLYSLALASAKQPLPKNIILFLYASEWLEEVAEAVEELERVGRYTAIPFVQRERDVDVARDAAGSNQSFAQWRRAQRRWLYGSVYTTPFLSHSCVSQEPLSVVLLSRRFSSAAQLHNALDTATAAAAPAAVQAAQTSPIERFFFRSLNITAGDEAQINAFFDDAEGALVVMVSIAGKVRSVSRFLLQYMYFLIPLTVAGVLVWSLCRPRRTR
ncbi:hypothetical protein ABL78_4177 [Leptomonas seymouri]|uniref:Uncharacterized protein n=1 Tax=Leptomonas seymouri TaxID=5684 RepID=A0A0N1I575_LEPSE|nr:hypothetical protein ABL78_4177 [Leptomonas seymouri]|eukprot:KPI86760.1 hypothetical protein ABL78_4177 [Leptomonas seymouri]